MAVSSPPSLPSSFDPAIHLHSEPPDNALPTNHPSESFSDDLEALHLHRLEQTRKGIVIQHRAWNLSDVFRSDDDITLGMQTVSMPVYALLQCICRGMLETGYLTL